MKLCRGCGEAQPYESFAKNARSADGHCDRCRTCMRAYYAETRMARRAVAVLWRARVTEEAREWLRRHLSEHPCVDCGSTDIRVLEFDHLDPQRKDRDISRMLSDGCSLSAIAREVSLCEVRCANCHRRVTNARANTARHQAELLRRALQKASVGDVTASALDCS